MKSNHVSVDECPLCGTPVNSGGGSTPTPALADHIRECPERVAAVEQLERRSAEIRGER